MRRGGPAAFAGDWRDEDGVLLRIVGEEVHLPDGGRVKLTTGGLGICCSIQVEGETFEGRLASDGSRLTWGDGGVWVRDGVRSAGSADSSPRSSSPCPAAQHFDFDAPDGVRGASFSKDGNGAQESETSAFCESHQPEPVENDVLERSQKERAARAWAKDRRKRLEQELREAERFAPDRRRTFLRALQRELHPDKQPLYMRAHTQPLFLLVQHEWEGLTKKEEEKMEKGYPRGQQGTPRRSYEQPRRRPEATAGHNPEQQGRRYSTEADRRRQEEKEKALREAENKADAQRRFREEADRRTEEHDAARKSEADTPKESEDDLKEAAAKHEEATKERRRQENERRRQAKDSQASSARLDLRVHDYVSHSCTVVASRDWLVGEVKDALQSMLDLPHGAAQRLFLGTDVNEQELPDDLLLSALPAGSSLDVSLLLCTPQSSDYELLAKKVRRSWRALKDAPLKLRADRGIVSAAVRQSWMALQFASTELRADRELCQVAVTQNGLALEHVAEHLRSDRALALTAVKTNWRALRFVSSELKADNELVLVAAMQDPAALEHAAEDLLNNRSFFLVLVQQHGQALQFASTAIRRDRQVVKAAVAQDAKALQYAVEHLRNSLDVLSVVKNNGDALRFLQSNDPVRDQGEKDLWDQFFGAGALRNLK
eukprot:gnl/TRDRNA2_/TRDRNA2_42930_c0_seq1.p1 gnl/TRDRNA2_/TRDRNA2_42930_c0~~gnl/TRDRNA2_/TRDRNA2_42930_c0_seq1.p1  ORF type:complete len:659 (-),score=148.18 gnl/TRDRNA2_/TRDRNA2_42930_c0_seq1:88-2064(-)